MKFFVDTANLDQIKQAHAWGILDGVTTNPSLIATEHVPYKHRVIEICDVVGPGVPVSAECVEPGAKEMLAEAKTIAKWHPNVYVKVPMTMAGVEVMTKLAPEGIRFNCTLIFSLPQALIACKAGASFISFFVGRIDDMGSGEASQNIADAVAMVENYDFKQDPEILVASIRGPLQIVEAIRAGAHICTIPYKTMEMLFHHPLTDIGIEKFAKDYQKALEDAKK